MSTFSWVANCINTQAGPAADQYKSKIYSSFGWTEDDYRTEAREIEDFLLKRYKPTSFCHNDLHNKNLKQSEGKIYLIDFDHADYGFRGYDLAYYLLHCGHEQTKKFIRRDKYPEFIAFLQVSPQIEL